MCNLSSTCCTQLFTEKHVHFTTPDDFMALILFKFLYCSFYEKKTANTVNVLKSSTHRFFFVFFFYCFFFKHVHFTSPDDVMTLILFKFLYCSFYDKKQKTNNEYSKCSKILNTSFFVCLFVCLFVFLFFLQNASKCSCSPRTYVVEVVPEHLYMSRLMTKSTKWLCAQPKLRSVWASA